MGIALEDRQAIEVRPNPAHQHVVAVVQQVMRGNGRAHVGRSRVDELHGVRGGDVFEDHFEGRETLDHTTHVLVDEDFFSVEHVDIAPGDFTVDQQRHPDFGHGLECREDFVDAGDARIRVGGRASRVQLGGVNESAGLGLANFFRLGAVGQVQDHQWLEQAAGRAGSENPLPIAVGFGRIAYRWNQVGHDDGAAKGARDIRDGIGQHGTIAKMNMPVVGTQQGQAVGHEGIPGGSNSRECYRKRLLQALAIKFCRKLPISNRYAVNMCVSVFLL
ncbi:hypothetical protein D9M70_131040 [compost metagenome]